MALERSEAVVLRGVDFSQSSRIVTFLCPKRGRMACMAKGARRAKSSTAALLDTYHRLEIVFSWKDTRGVQQLTDCSLLDAYSGVRQNLEKSMCAAVPLEIAYTVAHENEPSEALYGALVRGLEGFETWTGDARDYCSWFMLRLLAAAGFAPSVTTCCGCGKSISDAAGFSYGGGATCSRCASDERLSARSYALLRAYSEAEVRCPEVDGPPELFGVLQRYASRQLERRLKSVHVVEQLYRSSSTTRSDER